MMYLGIDPGTSCGWALLDASGQRVGSGAWNLKPHRHEGGGMRYLRARRYLLEVLATAGKPVAVAYEEVRRHMSTDAAHVYGGIVGIVAATCEEQGIPYQALPVGQIKVHATSKGNASKDAMMEAAHDRFGVRVLKDDEADALWIADLLRVQLA